MKAAFNFEFDDIDIDVPLGEFLVEASKETPRWRVMLTPLPGVAGERVGRTASPRQGGETGLFSSPAVACNSRENSGVFRRSSRDGRLLCPTAGAVFMLLRSAMSAAAGHAISPFMLSACVGGGLTILWCHSLLSYLEVLSATAEYQPLNPSMWPT